MARQESVSDSDSDSDDEERRASRPSTPKVRNVYMKPVERQRSVPESDYSDDDEPTVSSK